MIKQYQSEQIFYTYKDSITNQRLNPVGVLVGQLGTGKTSSLNKICEANEETRQGGQSTTRNVFPRLSKHPKYVFELIDGPGLGAKTETLEHAAGLYTALTYKPFSQIFLFSKYDKYDTIQDQIAKGFQLLEDCSGNITIVMTHWDQYKDRNNLYNEYINCYQMIKDYFGIDSVIFVGENTSKELISEAFYLNMNNDRICFSDYLDIEHFTKRIDISIASNYQAKNIKEKYKKQFLEIYTKLQNDINNKVIEKSQDYADYFFAINTGIKDIAEGLCQQYYDELEFKFGQQLKPVLNYVGLKADLGKYITQLNKLTQEIINPSNTDTNSPEYRIRKCYCGEIWFLAQDCDGTTVCGRRVTHNDNQNTGNFYRLVWEGQTNYKIIKEQNEAQQQKTYNDQNLQSKGTGCGRSIVFRDLPRLPKEQLQQLLDAGLSDLFTIKEKIGKEGDFKSIIDDVLDKIKIVT